MDKGKLCGSLAIVCTICFLSISPVTTFAAELNTESVTQAGSKIEEDTQSAVKEKMKKASEKWKSLTNQQKEEVYSLLKEEIDTETKIMDKLAELGILEKEDTESMKSHILDQFNKLKESGEFPFQRQKNRRSK